jgi:hypothetical protein
LLVACTESIVNSRPQESAHFPASGVTQRVTQKTRNGFRSPPSVAIPSLLLFLRVTLSPEKHRLTGAAVSKYAAIQDKRWTRRFFLTWAITC